MTYIVERDIEIEVIDESDGVMHEAAYNVAGLGRCAVQMPAFTEEELRIDLGETYDKIERMFANRD